MAYDNWTWADLNNDQLQMLHDGEQTLGAEYLLAYQRDQTGSIPQGLFARNDLQPAVLDDSQLECLQGLEQNVQAVVVAYQQNKD